MAISYEDALSLKDELEPEYAERHEAHAKLRKFWHGKYWDTADSATHGITSIFQDVTGRTSDVGPDVKLVRNLVFEVCVKYQSYLSSLPMIRTFVQEPYSTRRRAQATLKERVLYATWAEADMNRSLNQMAWFGPLMGDSFHGIWPDFDNNTVKSLVRSPEYAFPIVGYDGQTLDALIFSWKIPQARAKRAFPTYTPIPKERLRGRETESTVEILEYTDGHQFMRWVDGQLVNGIEHNLGFNLFEQVPFIYVPGEAWNHGAVEQSVGMVEAGNVLYSLLMQSMIENVFPKLILEDPLKFGENLDTGPGAVIPVNPGGKAYYLEPPNNTIGGGGALLQENERAIKQDTSMPDVNFGQFKGSIVTGKAINELQGAGTGSLVEMVQGYGIGSQLVKWNEKALTIYQRMFSDDKVHLYGVRPETMTDLNPRQFDVKFKGSEIVGSPRNEVVFSPYIGMHEKLVISLQAQGAGLTSKKYGRDQIGIPDSDGMEEEIFAEAIDAAVLGAIVQQLQTPDADGAEAAEAKASAYLSGATQPHPLIATSANVAGVGAQPPAPTGTLPGGGQVSSPALALPPGSPPAGVAPSPAASAPPAGVTLQQAQDTFNGVALKGRAWLVGEIVAQGATQHEVEVEIALTDEADKQTLADAATFPVVFHTVSGEPKEQHVELGGTGQVGGQEPTLDQLVA